MGYNLPLNNTRDRNMMLRNCYHVTNFVQFALTDALKHVLYITCFTTKNRVVNVSFSSADQHITHAKIFPFGSLYGFTCISTSYHPD